MKIKFFIYYLIALILFSWTLSAEQSIEEMEKKLAKVSGKDKMEILNLLAFKYRNVSVEKVLEYGEEALNLAKNFKDLKGEGTALKNISIGYQLAGDFEKALKNAKKSLEIFEGLKDKGKIAGMLNALGNIYYHFGYYDETLEYFQKSLKLFEELGMKKEIASVLGNTGVIYKHLKMNDKDLDYQLRALAIREEIGDERGIGISLHNIAYTYWMQKDYDKALEYFNKSLSIEEKLGNKSGIAMTLDSIGRINSTLKDYEKALEYALKSLRIKEETGEKTGICITHNHVGEWYMRLKKYDKALEHYLKALKLGEEIGDRKRIPFFLTSTALVYAKLKDFDKAWRCLKRSKELAPNLEKESDEAEAYCFTIYEIYTEFENYKKAHEYYKRYIQKKDKRFNDEKNRQLIEIQTKYETVKKEKEIETLKKDKQIQQLLLERQAIIRDVSIIISVLVLIVFFQFFRRYRDLFTFWKKSNYIAHYKLIDKIGSGGMGDIYKARDIRDKSRQATTYAIKVLKAEYYKDEKYKTRFKNEAALIDQLHHPNIVKVMERGEHDGTLYIAMELLEGESLADLLEREKHISFKDSLSIMIQMASALAEIHKRGIIHRDLKPENIMITRMKPYGLQIKILDFGLARTQNLTRLTRTGMVMGTIFYISPEQLSRSQVFPASDIYSLGVIYYQILTGKKPFTGDTAFHIARQILKKEPVNMKTFQPDIPADLTSLVERMMAKDPQNRPLAIEVFTILKALIASIE